MIDRRTILSRLPQSGRWYSIHNAVAERATIRIFEEIGYWGISEEDFARDLEQITAEEIEVQISSAGGEAFAGIAIYNQLRAHPARIITRVDGLAASAASVIVQAGDHRMIMSSAQMMIHDAWGLCVGPAEDMREYADVLDKLSANLAGIYAARSGGDADAFRELMRTDTYLTDAEAVELGLADEVFEPPSAAARTTPAALGSLPGARLLARDNARNSTGPTGQEDRTMDYATLRAEHGIADDVTDEEIADVLSALGDDQAEPATAEDNVEEPTVEDGGDATPAATATEAENAALRATVATLTAREEERSKREAAAAKASVKETACRQGQITPNEWAEVWEPFYDADPAKATTQLSKLPHNRIPVTEIGTAGGSADDADARYAQLTADAPSYKS